MTASSSLNLGWQGVRDDLVAEQRDLSPRTLDDVRPARRARRAGCRASRARRRRSAWITGGNNVLRRTNLPQRMMATLWPQLELIVDVNPKLTFTGMHADYLLPAAGYYEKPGIKYPVAYVPYLHYCDAAVPPLGESKNEWEIFWLPGAGGRAPRPRARAAGARRLRQAVRSTSRRSTPALHRSTATSDRTTTPSVAPGHPRQQHLHRRHDGGGAARRPASPTSPPPAPSAASRSCSTTDWKGEGVLRPLTHFTEHKWRWPTLQRAPAVLHRPPLVPEGRRGTADAQREPEGRRRLSVPVRRCHARWSVHSIWRDDPDDAAPAARRTAGLPQPDRCANGSASTDCGWAELFNRYGSMRMRVKHLDHGAARRGLLLPRLGAAPVPQPRELQVAHPGPDEPAALRGRRGPDQPGASDVTSRARTCRTRGRHQAVDGTGNAVKPA